MSHLRQPCALVKHGLDPLHRQTRAYQELLSLILLPYLITYHVYKFANRGARFQDDISPHILGEAGVLKDSVGDLGYSAAVGRELGGGLSRRQNSPHRSQGGFRRRAL
jgi:hypothetical protein